MGRVCLSELSWLGLAVSVCVRTRRGGGPSWAYCIRVLGTFVGDRPEAGVEAHPDYSTKKNPHLLISTRNNPFGHKMSDNPPNRGMLSRQSLALGWNPNAN
jgi:hypothetical protein